MPTSALTISPTGPITLVTHLPWLPAGAGSGDPGAGVFGAAPQWADGSDATYARVLSVMSHGVDYATVPLDPLPVSSPSQILAATLDIRVSSPTLTSTEVNFRIAKSDGDSGTLVGDADPTILTPMPAGDVPVTFTGIALDWSDPIADVLVQSPLAIYIWPSPNTSDLKIYEVTLHVTVDLPSATVEQASWDIIPMGSSSPPPI